MKNKNSWTKQYRTVERKVIENGKEKVKKVTFLSKHGAKPSPLEIKFTKHINKMPVNKPKKRGIKDDGEKN